MWPIYLLGLTWSIPTTPITAYLTLILKGLGWNTFQTNLLTIPAYILFLLQLIFWTWVSEKINNRFLIVLFCQIYMLPLLVALEVIPTNDNPWIMYTLSILMVGYPYIHAIIGWYIQDHVHDCSNTLFSCPHKSQCRVGSNSYGRIGYIQHGCPGKQYHILQREYPS
jgi:hypothetical protein